MPARPLDRSDPFPLWAQLERDLQRRIDAGEFGDGTFPTDLALTEAYRVSRHTVREAIRHLNRQGILTRERGRGTVINRERFEQPLGTLYSLFQTIESSGAVQDSIALGADLVVDEAVAERLELASDALLFALARVRCADGVALAVDRAWLPATGIEELTEVDWTRTALYAELSRIGAAVPDRGWERLTPVRVDASEAALLDVAVGLPCFSLERLGKAGDRPVEWRHTVIRGDRYRFVADWSAGVGPSLYPAPARD